MTTLYGVDGHIWERITADDEAIDYITNRDHRRAFADIAFWFRDNRYQIKPSVMRALMVTMRFKLPAPVYQDCLPFGMFRMLAVYISNDKKRYEWVMAQLTLLGFSSDSYPSE